MKINVLRNVLVFIVVLTIGLSVISMMRFLHFKSVKSTSNPVEVRRLPDDVDFILKGYSYSEKAGDMEIKMSGQQMVRRGKKLLGLRSNLAKTIFIKELQGTLTTPLSKISFSAEDAEWDANPSHPLVLQKEVTVSKNNKSFKGIKSARIFFRKGLIELNGDKTEVHAFK